MTSVLAPGALSLRLPIVASTLLHVAGVAAVLLARGAPLAPVAPTYRVTLIAAPPGERRIGVVGPAPVTAPLVAAAPAAAPVASTTPVPEKSPGARLPAPATKRATPNAAAGGARPAAKGASGEPASPMAGGGPVGGQGADVANVKVEGIEFPFPGYLDNVVRQIALRFKPSRPGALRADVAFMLRRDGSIAGLRLTTRSGVYAFDTEAMGAVEAAAQARAFGPLPQGFPDDVLPVMFSFDPRLLR